MKQEETAIKLARLEYEIALITELVNVLDEDDPLLEDLEDRVDRMIVYLGELQQIPKLKLIVGGKK